MFLMRRLCVPGHKWPLSGLLLAALAACATSGPVDNPIAQRLTWFTYAVGADIRSACTATAPAQYRFVYNGQYERQLRAYDLSLGPGSGGELLARARGRRGDLRRFALDDPFGPWALTGSRRQVSAAEIQALTAALERDATAAPAAAGQRLNSYEFYWLVSRCLGGVFDLQAFVDPRVPHAALAFPTVLLRLDDTGVEFRPARRFEGQREDAFQLHINRDGTGLVGSIVAF